MDDGDATPHIPYNGETDTEMGQLSVSEVFSPPRVSPVALRAGLKQGFALDLSADDPVTGRKWDFSQAADREAARRLVIKMEPGLLIATPPCTWFSLLMRWNSPRMAPGKVRKG